MRNTTYLLTVYILTLFAAIAALSGCSERASVTQAPVCAIHADHIVVCQDGSSFETKDGAAGGQGATSANGEAGAAGATGATGPQGIPGPKGDNGTPGSTVGFVKFCSEVTNYPSTFPEYGLCVDGSIYAVYSANGGFGVYLPPGTYNSNAINSACTFTVNAGCVVTH